MKTKKYNLKCSYWLLFLICTLSSVTAHVNAQTLHVEQLHHDFKVHKDLESSRLYWPKALPVYVWLSTSADQNSPKHQLTNAQLSTAEGKEPIEKAKIDLELSGNQFLRWINYNTKDTLLLQFQSDGIKPTSTITLEGAAVHQKEARTYIGKGLKASFSGKDTHSGVENIYVSVNGASFSPYFGTYDFNQEKDYTVFYYAVDNVGNVEPVQSSTFTVDLSPPISKHHIEGIHQGAILSSTATISLNSQDALSGVKSISYAIDKTNPDSKYTNPISITSLAEGEHTLYYLATDEVENIESANTFDFYLDRTPPTTKLLIEGDQYPSSKLYVSNRTQYRLESNDNKTGVFATHYQINEDDSISYQKGSFQLPEQENEYLLSFWSVDNVSNVEEKDTQPLVLDATPPTSKHSFNGIFFTQRGRTWIPPSTTVSINANDKGAGVQQIQYSIEGESQNVTYSTPLTFTNEGNANVTYWSIDHVNNQEEAKNLSLVIDNTPPTLLINFSSAKIGSANATDGSVLDQYPANTTLYPAATDASSGAKGLWYSINDGDEKPFTSAINFSETGEQKVTLRSSDNVGNETTQVLRFLISD